MKRRVFLAMPLCVLAALPLAAHAGSADRSQPLESIWIEAEQLHGIRGTCWPMGKPEMRKTAGHWGISGPGWAAEWNQGGESGFLSIACGADDEKAEASIDLEIPAAGTYRLWVRYRDVREASNRFQVEIKQPGGATPWLATFGRHPLFDEDNLMKLYWGAAFGWEAHEATLTKGNARLILRSAFKESDCRQIDCMVLTTDSVYRPWIKERPTNYAWQVLQDRRNKVAPEPRPLSRTKLPLEAHAAWKVRTFNDRGFLFLWNVNQFDWLSDDPKRILFPYSLSLQPQDQDVREEFQKTFAGRSDVPVFADPRIVPVFHGAGPLILDAAQGKEHGEHVTPGFVHWLDNHPQRAWATMMNYAADTPMTPEAYERFLKYRDRYIGSVAGENLGYFEPYVDSAAKQKAFSSARSRRELAEALGQVYMQANRAKWRAVYGRDVEAPYREVIPVIGTAYYPLC